MAKKATVTPTSELEMPPFGSLGWTDYVISLFHPDELADGKYPKFVGLLRVADELGFDIRRMNVDIRQCPANDNNRRATAISTISYFPPAMARKTFAATPQDVPLFESSDAADCSEVNTRTPFAYHPVATASTMAQARNLRKILRLNTHAAEEMQAPDDVSLKSAVAVEQGESGIQMGQKTAIMSIAARLNINVAALIRENLPYPADLVSDATIHSIKEVEASTLLRLLNRYQKNPGDKDHLIIPESIMQGK